MNAPFRLRHVSHDALRKYPARRFKTMAEDLNIIKLTNLNSIKLPTNTDTGSTSTVNSGDNATEKHINTAEEPSMSCNVFKLQIVSDDSNRQITGKLSLQAVNTGVQVKNDTELEDTSSEHRFNANQTIVNSAGDKENIVMSSSSSTSENTQEEDTSGQRILQHSNLTASKQHSNTEDNDAEARRKAQEEGCVNVVLPGTVTQEGCCRFVSEILKFILYQRQQLPMTYDQLVYSQKKQLATMQDKDVVSRRPAQSADMGRRKCQQTLQELEEVLQQLEVLFSLSKVPRVLLLMGGSLVLPKELYEINMEALILASGDQCLRVSSCLRQLFRTLFVADLLSDTRPVRLMPTTVLVLAHRDCGVGWFRPKLQFKVPTRVKNQIIALSTDPSICTETRAEGSDWQDYVWFQAPMTIKGLALP
ncbi:MAD2L1-binding protein [Scomber scombrus]|uniref:MAD2L1-binding protein n=1 Tax=Scomber scombrus TaxID=13677 RepID=A0AAV1MYV9_SCOSC